VGPPVLTAHLPPAFWVFDMTPPQCIFLISLVLPRAANRSIPFHRSGFGTCSQGVPRSFVLKGFVPPRLFTDPQGFGPFFSFSTFPLCFSGWQAHFFFFFIVAFLRLPFSRSLPEWYQFVNLFVFFFFSFLIRVFLPSMACVLSTFPPWPDWRRDLLRTCDPKPERASGCGCDRSYPDSGSVQLVPFSWFWLLEGTRAAAVGIYL